MGGSRGKSPWIEMSDLLHTLVALILGIQPLLPIGQ